MKLSILRVCVLASLLVVANTSFAAPSKTESVKIEKQSAIAIKQTKDVKDVIDKYIRSVETLNQNLAEQAWETSPNTTFIHPRGHEKTWARVWQNFYLNTMGVFSERKLTMHGLQVYIHGDTAYAEFYWDFDAIFKNDGAALKSAGRENQLLVRTGKGWKISHVHYSNMPVTGERQGF